MRVRRARTVLVHWHDDRLVFANYRTGVSIGADPAATEVLDFFNCWRTPAEIIARFPEHRGSTVRATVRQLLQATLLVREGTSEARRDVGLERAWSHWLPYGAFHFATKDVSFVLDRPADRQLRAYLKQSEQPAFFKTYRDRPRLRLPPQTPPAGEFLRVLTTRKTHREFSAERLQLSSISNLLYYTWGVAGYVASSVLGRLPHKTSPSGGARHPGEVYLMALRVDGLPSGLYHYDSQHHALERVRNGATPRKAREYCAGQRFAESAGALFLMTAVVPRVMWKYRFARAYRIVLLDAGHLCQTFCLTATWLGLAPFCTAAMSDSLIERDLGLDGVTEVALYIAGVGSLP